VHRVQSSGSGASVRRTVVSPFMHSLYVALKLQPIVSLPDFLMVFLAPSCPPSCQTDITASTSFTLLEWMTIWSVLDISCADSQWCYSQTSPNSRDLHWA
jgi:hypothetical protein